MVVKARRTMEKWRSGGLIVSCETNRRRSKGGLTQREL